MLSRAVSLTLAAGIFATTLALAAPARAEGDWEITPESDAALRRGLAWLARNQGPEGNWESNDLGLVSMGALAFLAAGHTPGVGQYGKNVDRALNYVLKGAKPLGPAQHRRRPARHVQPRPVDVRPGTGLRHDVAIRGSVRCSTGRSS